MRAKNVFCLLIFQVAVVTLAPAVSLSGAINGSTIDYSGPNPGFAGLFNVTGVGAGSMAAQTMADLINGDDGPNHWNAFIGVSPVAGNINVTNHSVFDGSGIADARQVYATLQATYTGDSTLDWIQIISTIAPGSGHTSSPYIDVSPGDDPFYPYITQGNNGSSFEDMPSRFKPANPIGESAPDNILEWKADLFLVGVSNDAVTDGHKTVTILDGIEWGFRLIPDRDLEDTGPPGIGFPHAVGGTTADAGLVAVRPVPEPSSLVTLAPCVYFILRRRQARVRR